MSSLAFPLVCTCFTFALVYFGIRYCLMSLGQLGVLVVKILITTSVVALLFFLGLVIWRGY